MILTLAIGTAFAAAGPETNTEVSYVYSSDKTPAENAAALQAAVDAAGAGATIKVSAGTYDVSGITGKQLLLENDGVSLIGETGVVFNDDGEGTPIGANEGTQGVIEITGDNVTVKNIEAIDRDGNTVILVSGANNVTIEGCSVKGYPNATWGQYLEAGIFIYCSDVVNDPITKYTVKGNTLTDCNINIVNGAGNGGKAEDLLISGNTFNNAAIFIEHNQTSVPSGAFEAWHVNDILVLPTITGNTFESPSVWLGTTPFAMYVRVYRDSGVTTMTPASFWTNFVENNTIMAYTGEKAGTDSTYTLTDTNGLVMRPNGMVLYYGLGGDALVAEIDGVGYTSLQAAVDAAGEGDTVTLLSEITLTETVVIPEDLTVTLDLNGQKIYGAYNADSTTDHIYALHNYGTLTITDSVGGGAIVSRGIYNYGSLTLEAGTIDACDCNGGRAINGQAGSTFTMNGGAVVTSYEDGDAPGNGYDATPVYNPEGATVTLNGGTITNASNFTYSVQSYGTLNVPATSTVEVSGIHGAVYAMGGNVTIDGGTFTNTHNTEVHTTGHALCIDGANVTIGGGTFNSKKVYNGFAVDMVSGTLVINGGTFNGHTATSDAEYSNAAIALSASGSITIKDGTFNHGFYISSTTTGTLSITGGIFYTDPSAYVADGYSIVEGEGVWYVVKAPDAQLSTGEVCTDLADAAAKAQSGDTITLLRNVTLESRVKFPAGVTLKSDGFTIDGSIEMLGDLNLDGDLTITGGLWASNGGKLNGDTLTAYYAMFQKAEYIINADLELDYGYLSFGGTFVVNSTIHTVGKSGEVLYINGVVDLVDGAVLDADRGIFVSNSNAVLNVNEGSRIDGNVKVTAAGAQMYVTGGTVNGTMTVTGENAVLEVTGGSFSEDPSEYVPEGYFVSTLADGTYMVCATSDAEVKIGETYYATLRDAIAAIEESGEITLLKSIDLDADDTITIPEGKTIVLDLGKYTITGVSDDADKNDDGKFTSADNEALFDVRGTLTVKNGTVSLEHKSDDMGWAACADTFYVAENGALYVENATIKNLGGTDMAYAIDLVNAKNITLDIRNSTINSAYIPVRVFNNSSTGMNNVTIEGSTLEGGKAAFWVHIYTTSDWSGEGTKDVTLNLDIYDNDNTFIGGKTSPGPIYFGFTNAFWYTAEGEFICVDAENTKGLKEAFANGRNVRLYCDIELTESLTVPAGKTVVLDLNGHVLSGVSSEETSSCVIDNSGTLTVKDSAVGGKITSQALNPDVNWGGEGEPEYPTYANNTINNSGVLILESGTIENATPASKGACYAIDNYYGGTITLNGGLVDNKGNIAIRQFIGSAHTNTVTVNKGAEVAGTRAIWVQLANEDTAIAPDANVYVNGGKLTSYGNTDKNGYDWRMAIYVYSYGNCLDNVNIEIGEDSVISGDVLLSGGTKNGSETVVITGGVFTNQMYGIYSYGGESAAEKINISGGRYSLPVDPAYLAEGYIYEAYNRAYENYPYSYHQEQPDLCYPVCNMGNYFTDLTNGDVYYHVKFYFGVQEGGTIIENGYDYEGIGVAVHMDMKAGGEFILGGYSAEMEGYSFLGWLNDAGETVTSYTVTGEETDFVRFTADMRKDPTITFDLGFELNEETGYSNELLPVTLKYGETLDYLPVRGDDFERYYYVFTGWFTEGGVQVDETTPFTEDTTLYAHWEKRTVFTLILNAIEKVGVDEETGEDIYDFVTGATITVTAPDGSEVEAVPGEGIYEGCFFYRELVAADEYTVTITRDGYRPVVFTTHDEVWEGTTIADAGLYMGGIYNPVSEWEEYTFEITKQPEGAKVAVGETFTISVEAVGDGLTYQWYYKNAGAADFTLTTAYTGNTYSIKATDTRVGRQVYCVVTDQYGNSLTSDIATITLKTNVALSTNPVGGNAAEGDEFTLAVEAVGDGLTYQWYSAAANADQFVAIEGATEASYTFVMTKELDGYRYMCTVSDEYGNKKSTDPVSVVMQHHATIVEQPKSAVVELGEIFSTTVKATGDGLTYAWYWAPLGSDEFTLTTAYTGDTYSVKITEGRDGRQVYCVVTDQYGNSVKSDIATMVVRRDITIVEQPKSATVDNGELFVATVVAEGDGLTYQWYYKNAGASEFTLTTAFTGDTYQVKMSDARDGRQVYCVITDEYGHTTQTVVATMTMARYATIVEQPLGAVLEEGELFSTTVAATGHGLTYQWYYKNAGDSEFKVAENFTGDTYQVKMSLARDGRQIYCVITDQYGTSVTSNTVSMEMVKHYVTIVKQPQSAALVEGAIFATSVEATGDGLTYQWYYKSAGSSNFKLTEAYTTDTYSVVADKERDGRQIYCVVTDRYGNSVQTEVATLTVMSYANIIVQPQSATVANGGIFRTGIVATGDGLTYQWYYKNAGSSEFTLTTAFTGNTYQVAMSEARDGRQVYCVVTDQYGNSVTSEVATMTMERTELRIISQPQSASVANGKTFRATVVAEGDGLTYEWYYKNSGGSSFKLTTTFTSNTYQVKMSDARDGRQIYCIITDQYGNSVTTDIATMSMK